MLPEAIVRGKWGSLIPWGRLILRLFKPHGIQKPHIFKAKKFLHLSNYNPSSVIVQISFSMLLKKPRYQTAPLPPIDFYKNRVNY